jgi:adsorption protein B
MMGVVQAAVDGLLREAMLFAAVGLLIGGLDDLVVDLLFLIRRVWRGGRGKLSVAALAERGAAGRIVVFVPAWDEQAVIGAMLTRALARWHHPNYRIHVGLYPNDPGGIAAVMAVAARDPRVRPVIGAVPGPTTKAACLNTLWHDLVALNEVGGEADSTRAIVLHDAEDLVHPDELTVFDALIGDHAVVQLPVMPLVKPGSPFVSGHYADEFALAHGVQLPVRTAIGAGMPLAGTGCAVAPWIVARLAAVRGGDPFDPVSLVEDYELGLRIAELGGRGVFARVADAEGGLVAVRAYFPATVTAAVRQKSRWITGIALAGWDRTGWARPLAVIDHWMRARDRRAPIAVLVLVGAYAAMLAWLASAALHGWTGAATAAALTGPVRMLLPINAALLLWRLAMRAGCTGHAYGWRQAVLSVPRIAVGNVVLLLAAARASWRYAGMLRGIAPAWDKTAHAFPDEIAHGVSDVAIAT